MFHIRGMEHFMQNESKMTHIFETTTFFHIFGQHACSVFETTSQNPNTIMDPCIRRRLVALYRFLELLATHLGRTDRNGHLTSEGGIEAANGDGTNRDRKLICKNPDIAGKKQGIHQHNWGLAWQFVKPKSMGQKQWGPNKHCCCHADPIEVERRVFESLLGLSPLIPQDVWIQYVVHTYTI